MHVESVPNDDDVLAIFGGAPCVTGDGWADWPVFSSVERDAVQAIMSGRNSADVYASLPKFEAEVRSYFGCDYALSLTNGTAALHSALFGVGIEPGDEVITCSYTYWATVLSLRLVGAVPVFADVLKETGGIDPAHIERLITKRTRAIMLVHLWGLPSEMDEIMDIARRHGLKVIEDCSHAHGAEYKGRKVGTFGDAGCFSMQCSKNLPAMEGGFLTTNDPDVFARACALGHYGRIPEDHELHRFNLTGLGYKYRINPAAAAIGIHRLRSLDERNGMVGRRMKRFFEGISDLPGLIFFDTPSDRNHVYYQAEVKYEEQETGVSIERVIEALCAEGAGVAYERYPLQHEQNIYKDAGYWHELPHLPESLPATEYLHERVIQIPTFAACEEFYVDQFIAAFRKVWRHFPELAAEKCEASPA